MAKDQNVNVYSRNQNAQGPVTPGNSRETDARALLSCARRLDDAKIVMTEDSKSKENMKLYCDAIRHNQRLWTIFQVALSDPQNPLPENLKRILLNLSRYIDRTSFRAIGKYAPDLLDSLININRIIAKGLSKPVSAETAASFVPPVDTRNIPTSLITTA